MAGGKRLGPEPKYRDQVGGGARGPGEGEGPGKGLLWRGCRFPPTLLRSGVLRDRPPLNSQGLKVARPLICRNPGAQVSIR